MRNVNVLIFLFLFVKFTNAAIQLDKSCLERPQACDDNAFSIADWFVCGGDVWEAPADEVEKGTGQRANNCYITYTCDKVEPTSEEFGGLWTASESTGALNAGTIEGARMTCNSDKIVLNSPIYTNAMDWEETWEENGYKLKPIWKTKNTGGDYGNPITTGALATFYKDEKGNQVDLDNFLEIWVQNDDGTGAAAQGLQLKNYKTLTDHLDGLLAKRAACVKWFADGTAVCTPWNPVFDWIVIPLSILAGFGLCYVGFLKATAEPSAGPTSSDGGNGPGLLPSRNYYRRGARVFRDGI